MVSNFVKDLEAEVLSRMPSELHRLNPGTNVDVRAIIWKGVSSVDWRSDDENNVLFDRLAEYHALIKRCKVEHALWLERVLEIVVQVWTERAEKSDPEMQDREWSALDHFKYETARITAEKRVGTAFFKQLWVEVDKKLSLPLRRQNPNTVKEVGSIIDACQVVYETPYEELPEEKMAQFEAVFRRCEVEHPDWLSQVLRIVNQAWTDLAEKESLDERWWHFDRQGRLSWKIAFMRNPALPWR